MRDFLFSETALAYRLPNLPTDEKLAIEVGEGLCQHLLEPLCDRFGHIHIRSAFRSEAVNEIGNRDNRNCASNEANFADHIWDRMDGARKGATACVVIPAFYDAFQASGDWTELAWWVHDHLPYNTMFFFTREKSRWAFNLNWSTGVSPERRIDSYEGRYENGEWTTKRLLTKIGMANNEGDHSSCYARLEERLSQ